MTRRDEHLWEEEVVEIFLDLDRSGHDYYELEISPANVVCDLRMISASPDKKGDLDWNLAGLETRVHPAKDKAGRTTGWTATAFLPWKGFRTLPSASARRAAARRPGDAGASTCSASSGPAARPIRRRTPSRSPGRSLRWTSFHAPAVFRDLVFLEAAR